MDENLKKISFVLKAGEAGIRIDTLLSRRYDKVTRNRWQDRIKSGEVLLNGRPCKSSQKLKTGDNIEFSFIAKDEPEVNRDYSILFQDEELLIVNKPPNLPVHPSGVYFENTLFRLLKDRFGEDFTVHLAHRLDRETSGLIVLGMNPRAAHNLNKTFESRDIRKEYLALVEDPDARFPARLSARGFLMGDEESPVHKKRKFQPETVGTPTPRLPSEFRQDTAPPVQEYTADGRRLGGEADAVQWAHTEFRHIRHLKHHSPGLPENLSLVQARLYTGRLHQIRATLCSLGYPMVGDRLYGVEDRLYIKFIEGKETEADRKLLRLNRTALHCRRLSLPHPGHGRRICFVAPLPEDLKSLIDDTTF